jgi:hypothetical protein
MRAAQQQHVFEDNVNVRVLLGDSRLAVGEHYDGTVAPATLVTVH